MIEVKNLTFGYKKNIPPVLKDLSFVLRDSTVLSILGQNGVGKTTFIRCLTAEVRDYAGTISVDGREVRSLSINELSKAIAVVASNNPCYQDAICQGAFLQKLQIVQQNLHEGYRGRIGCTV